MTETLTRPSAPSTPASSGSGRRAPATPVAGVVAAVAAVLAGLLLVALPVWLAWAADPRGVAPFAEAAGTAGQLWLLGHGADLQLSGGRVDLLPLGLAALVVLLLARAGAAVARRRAATSSGAALRCALAVAVPYAALAAAVAQLSATRTATPDLPSSVLGAAVLALVGAGSGALRPHGLARAAWLRSGPRTRRVLPAVLTASAVVLGGGALLVGGSLAVHGSRAADLAAAAQPGVAGGVALLLLEAAFAPNAAVWGASWLAGPGFAVGTATSVGPFAAELGAVPPLPLLAALPSSAVPVWLGVAALLLPVLAGALAGRLLVRVAADLPRRAVALDLLGVALGCGVVWTALAWLSGGAAGGQRLAALGPQGWQVGAALAAEVLTGALVAVLVGRRRHRRTAAAPRA